MKKYIGGKKVDQNRNNKGCLNCDLRVGVKCQRPDDPWEIFILPIYDSVEAYLKAEPSGRTRCWR